MTRWPNRLCDGYEAAVRAITLSFSRRGMPPVIGGWTAFLEGPHHPVAAQLALSNYESLFITVPRPKRCRQVCCDPDSTFFKPQGIPMTELEWVSLGLDELEALRLADADGLAQKEGAEMMGVSQPTFNRILSEARRKVAHSLVNGVAIRIENVGAVKISPRKPETVKGASRRHRVRGGGGGR